MKDVASLTFDPTVDNGMISFKFKYASSSDAVTLASSVVDGMVDGCYETDCCVHVMVMQLLTSGTCGGSGIADGACDCDGNVLDCNNECAVLLQKIFMVYAVVMTLVARGAALTLGAFDSSGSVEVLYEFGAGVAVSQFDLPCLSLTGGSHGAAEVAGMTVSVGGSTVVGFSLTNTEIPAVAVFLQNVF